MSSRKFRKWSNDLIAYNAGIVHRDLKPSNVMVTGLYVARTGRGKKIDARSDIFSLGSMLYEMKRSRGQLAFRGDTRLSHYPRFCAMSRPDQMAKVNPAKLLGLELR